MPNSNGRFVWHELVTHDPDAAATFYPDIVQWGTQPWDDIDGYTLWTNEGAPLGGMTQLSPELRTKGVPAHWRPYICVYDVDDCARQVKQLGGEVRVGPTETPNVGCWATVSDPQGAIFGLFEPAGAAPGHTGKPRRGEFSWHELAADDYKAAFEFYHKLFKWEKTGEFDMGEMGMYQMFGKAGEVFGGMFNRRPDMPKAHWVSYVRVDDVRHAAEKVKTRGGTVLVEPMEVPGGDWVAVFDDPHGAGFALHTPKA